MGGSSKTSSTTSTTENVKEVNLQDTGGFTIADNAGGTTLTDNSRSFVTNTTTDQGAVDAGRQIALAAIGANSDATAAALDLGAKAYSSGVQVANAGLDNALAANQGALTFGNNALDFVGSVLRQTEQSQSDLVSNALQGYQTIAQQNSASDSSQIQKVAIYLIVAVAAIMILGKRGAL